MMVSEMSEEDCIDVLAKGHIAHLACAKDNRPYVVPVQYVFDPGNIYVFSMPGQKIDWLRANALACVQVQAMGGGRHLAQRRRRGPLRRVSR